MFDQKIAQLHSNITCKIPDALRDVVNVHDPSNEIRRVVDLNIRIYVLGKEDLS